MEIIKTIMNFLSRFLPKKNEKFKLTEPDTHWMKQMRAWEGGSEFDPKFVALLEQGWKLTNVPTYKGLAGRDRAWCAMTVGYALWKTGYKHAGRADAKSYSKYGMPSGFQYGAILCIRHVRGSHHVTFFVRWKNEKKRIAICLGGNQNNKLQESEYNLSGNKEGHDEVIGGPRWPIKE